MTERQKTMRRWADDCQRDIDRLKAAMKEDAGRDRPHVWETIRTLENNRDAYLRAAGDK